MTLPLIILYVAALPVTAFLAFKAGAKSQKRRYLAAAFGMPEQYLFPKRKPRVIGAAPELGAPYTRQEKFEDRFPPSKL